jgi:serine-type D-Ala-D-Ala carboxypeptidase/endopeptidase
MHLLQFTALFLGSLCVAVGQADRIQGIVDRQVQPWLDGAGVMGLAVGILEDGESHQLFYGEVEKGSGQRPNSDTIFEIGSISKVFTGILLADLVHRELLTLNDELQKHLPSDVSLHAHGDQPIRLIDLATHTSGLPRLADNMPYSNPLDPYADYDAQLLHRFLSAHKLRRGVGEFEYSNLGMGLLGHILARRANLSYEALLVERICAPLGMVDTLTSLGATRMGRFAKPYTSDDEPSSYWDLNVLAGAGGIRSTCNDMLKFAKANLFPIETTIADILESAHTVHYNQKNGSALGLAWHRAGDRSTWWHNGQTGGFSSYLAVNKERKLAVIVLANSGTDKTTVVGEKIFQSVAGMNVPPIVMEKAIEIDAALLKDYLGTYPLTPEFKIAVTVEGEKLMIQATGQQKIEIYPKAPDEFFLKVVNAKIVFHRNEDGVVEKLVLFQGGQELPGVKEVD